MAEKVKQKVGRKLIKIDEEQVEKLAAMHCTIPEIASFFNVNEKTIDRRFAPIIRKGKEKGKIKLRRLQWRQAEEGSYSMAIWLGKQYLGQTDKVEGAGMGDIHITVVQGELDEMSRKVKEARAAGLMQV